LTMKHFLLERTFQGETRAKMDLELVRGYGGRSLAYEYSYAGTTP
jgi:hypothetical protein